MARSRSISVLVGLVLAALTLVGWEVGAAVVHRSQPAPPQATQTVIP